MKPTDAQIIAPKKLPVRELTRLAFVWAEQDRDSIADCWPPNSPERAEAENESRQLRAYRMKKWGRTVGDRIGEKCKTVSLSEIAKRK